MFVIIDDTGSTLAANMEFPTYKDANDYLMEHCEREKCIVVNTFDALKTASNRLHRIYKKQ